jgi:hydrogenase-4 component B
LEHLRLWLPGGALALLAAGACAALLFSGNPSIGRRIAHVCSALAGAAQAAAGIVGLSGGTLTVAHVRGVLPFTDILLQVTDFSAFFLLVIGAVGLAATIYAAGYVKAYEGRRSAPLLHAGMLLFIAAMAAVVMAGNVFTFLLAWEVMSVVSFFLVMYEHERPGTKRAGFVYVVMTHIGTVFLTIAFFILQHYSGSFEFARMGQASLPASAQSLVFVLALIGFGTKAGLVPLHIWLPRAHPAAPSHISALMSGVMLKTAVYGFLLITLHLLQPGPVWWGIAVLAVGANTALFGVLHALGEVDKKRMLAYSSIENMGILFMGIGAVLVFQATGQKAAASLALAAVLFHAMNHALFKSLLFMGAGAVLKAAHTANMNLLGGLIRRMPWTALFMLAGSLAMAAMPPLNGFVGEWLLFQSLFALGFDGPATVLRLAGALAVAALALVGALAAFLSVRLFAMTFLAVPRSDEAREAREASLSMRIAMGLLAACCVAAGVLPFVFAGSVQRALERITGISGASSILEISPAAVGGGTGEIAPAAAGLLILCGLAAAWALARAIGGNTRTVRGETWNCGEPLEPRMTYTASGFSKPIRVAFQRLLMPSRVLYADRDPRAPYFAKGFTYTSQLPPLVENLLYKPAMNLLVAGARLFRGIQNGVVQSYLLYLLATLVLILVWRIWR